jgi:hypothetical protein
VFFALVHKCTAATCGPPFEKSVRTLDNDVAAMAHSRLLAVDGFLKGIGEALARLHLGRPGFGRFQGAAPSVEGQVRPPRQQHSSRAANDASSSNPEDRNLTHLSNGTFGRGEGRPGARKTPEKVSQGSFVPWSFSSIGAGGTDAVSFPQLRWKNSCRETFTFDVTV